MFRISKLLASEFSEIYEPVIVESPFTQVTTSGVGIRQYHIALTASKILFACDDFEGVNVECYGYSVKPAEIETLALVCLMPLQALEIHFYTYNGRQIMRISKLARDEEKAIFLEIGGHMYKAYLWSTFWEKISCLQALTPKDLFSVNRTVYGNQILEV